MSKSTTTISQWPPNLPAKLRLQLSLYAAINKTDFGRKLLSVLAEARADASPHHPIHGVTSSDVTVDPDRHLWFRLFLPPDLSPSTPLLIYFHGGGFQSYSPDNNFFDALCRNLAREIPAVIVSASYRLTPFFRYPCQYEDGFDVLKFVDGPEFRSKYLKGSSGDLRKCFLAGDSAGGNIAHHVAVRASGHGSFKNLKLMGLIELMPFYGGEERTEAELRLKKALIIDAERTDKMWKTFLPEGADRDHGAANVMGPNGVDLSEIEFPKTLVICGGYDPLQDLDKRYCEWLDKCGKEVELKVYENAFHGFYCFQEVAETKMMIQDVKEFVHRTAAAAAGVDDA
uniref:Alpha/beta hydrolase fold-3 domain-containing protein n=1 Tax=Kalanchoe fedtschenkoi TaxID=63787 RepID=A0A7N1A572_KALFE